MVPLHPLNKRKEQGRTLTMTEHVHDHTCASRQTGVLSRLCVDWVNAIALEQAQRRCHQTRILVKHNR